MIVLSTTMETFLAVDIFAQLGWGRVLFIMAIAFATSCIHGATGIAGGFLLSAAIAPIIGVKPVVPVVSVALLISHSARALLNAGAFDRKVFLAIALPAVPCIAVVAVFYGRLSSPAIALILGLVVLSSVPIRHWAKSRKIKSGVRSLAGAGAVYGTVSGASIGAGSMLIPFMLGYGLKKEAFVATLAVIALSANITRVAVFGSVDLLFGGYLLLGLLVGLATIPGNWIGRVFLRRMNSDDHSRYVDVLTLVGALNFFWLALR